MWEEMGWETTRHVTPDRPGHHGYEFVPNQAIEITGLRGILVVGLEVRIYDVQNDEIIVSAYIDGGQAYYDWEDAPLPEPVPLEAGRTYELFVTTPYSTLHITDEEGALPRTAGAVTVNRSCRGDEGEDRPCHPGASVMHSQVILPLVDFIYEVVGPPVVDRIELSPADFTLVAPGATQTITAQAFDSGDTLIPTDPEDFDWSSSAESVATVSATGVVSAVQDGSATITAALDGVPGTSTAVVEIDEHTLSVNKDGDGDGSVSSDPAGIACDTACSADFEHGTTVTLTASPNSISTFAGWSGAGCSGTGVCEVTMEEAETVTATFELAPYTVSVSLAGSGSGTVTSSPAGIDCGTICSEEFENGTLVTLTATASEGSTFTGWSGNGCSGTMPCSFSLLMDENVTATFELDSHTLSVNKDGSGNGSVTSEPAGISCDTACASDFEHGTTVTLTAAPATGSTFAGWSGAECSGTGACEVTMTEDKSVTATFDDSTADSEIGVWEDMGWGEPEEEWVFADDRHVGFKFVPDRMIEVTRLRGKFHDGTTVTVYDVDGAQSVVSAHVAGGHETWDETTLSGPVTLEAGRTYVIFIQANRGTYFSSDGGHYAPFMPSSNGDVTVAVSCSHPAWGDYACQFGDGSDWNLLGVVDFVYRVVDP